ncbi:MAG TPA: helix-turn-helix domain-containing protein [Blastocatellia bacterium]|jgi:DNA-binding NtrC family response regulator
MQVVTEELRQKLELLGAIAERRPNEEAAVEAKIGLLQDVVMTLLDEVKALKDAADKDMSCGISLVDEVRRFEVSLIQRALEQTHGHQTRAAQLLGINLTTLNYKIKRYNIPLCVCPRDKMTLKVAS